MLVIISLPFLSEFYVNELLCRLSDVKYLILTFVFFSITLCFQATDRSRGSTKERKEWLRPKTYPSPIPFVGHLLMMGWDPPKFMSKIRLVIDF